MQIKKKDINKILTIFLFAHILVWTLIPTLSNVNLPLDTIEALAWSSNLDWGYSKHPPLSALSVEFFYQIFGNQDWSYYLLSQLFVGFSFYVIFKFSEDFFEDKIYSLFSVLILEGIYFYNYTTPEFNVNVCQLPFWALTVFYCWEGIKKNTYTNWLLLGLFAGLGILSKYLFIYLLIAIDFYFIYLLLRKKINYNFFISLVSFFIILIPHFIWLEKSNYSSITYAMHRTGLDAINLLDHFYYPITFLAKQIGILVPFLIMFLFLISKFKTKINFNDKRLVFLIAINLIPLLLIFLTSLVLGIKIRTMWMTPFYLFFGVLFFYIYKKNIILKNTRYFLSVFLILFIFSPSLYFYISKTQTDKRTDYEGKKISKIIQDEWDNNFTDDIKLVGGDEWYGGNLSYHLKSRPNWDNILENKSKINLNDINGGFIIVGNVNILQNICRGIFLEIDNQGFCLIGKKK
jgi:4-amino-4-deoxy-L-arabinose transferase-like glycosyltransferase